ncbi:glycosyl hydrolase family 61-domain-containing protein [Lasiosphaeria hispida]|uniref:lytic cellulose monooxygenase (C4-dehydrogenating) n=1 Tax=Lasiosphaeria hispida TaxID=260671 RepID=A0AAJ0H7K1_9PEZI|nr:glycosyl hydrolase family 61-domain-containing protein [Lasiosphaeria hispida]
MKSTFVTAVAALAANKVAGHALFQQLWVDGTDYSSTCIRMPASNSPITNVGSKDFICNAGTRGVAGKCAVSAGSTVTVEMHQQPGDRSCGSEAIGGQHWGPVQIYLTKVADASTADGSTGWFKIFSNSWTKKSGGRVGDDDNWGTRDLNACCGKMDVKIPSDIQAGDYLLRAEALALHTAGQANGAQFYVSCYQISVSGGGSASPATVKFPGAYSSNDPGIKINIHAAVANYIAPGPAVYGGGSNKTAGSVCTGCEKTCKPGSSPATSASSGKKVAQPTAAAEAAAEPAAPAAEAAAAEPEAAEPLGGCAAAAYGQCGGNGFAGCTQCAEGFTCKDVAAPYYSQCVPGS